MPNGQSRDVEPARRTKVVPARHAKGRRFGPGGAVTGIVLGIVGVLIVSTSAVGAVVVHTWQKVLDNNTIALDPTDAPAPDLSAMKGGFNILIVGTDARKGQGGLGGSTYDQGDNLNDVTMLIHVAQDQSNATVVSFPRDMQVTTTACGGYGGWTNKINVALSRGGLSCVAQAVKGLTGVPIQFAALISFKGVVHMANAIGGVPMCFTGPIDDPPSGLHIKKKGTYNISGTKALALLRSRHGVGDGSDWGRIDVRNAYLSALLRKVKSNGTLGNPVKLFGLANAAISNMEVSSSMKDPYRLVALALTLKNIPQNRVAFVQYPATTPSKIKGNYLPNTATANALMNYIKQDKPFKLATTAAIGGGATKVNPHGDATADPSVTGGPTSNAHIPTLQGVSGQTGDQSACVVPFHG